MDTNVVEKRKRPVMVWAISIFFFFIAAGSLISLYLLYFGKVPLPAEQKAYFESLSFLDIGLSVVVGLANMLGAVLLFCLRKGAFYFFVISFFANLSTLTMHIFTNGFVASLDFISGAAIIISYVMIVAVCIYIKKLEKNGILK